MRSRKASRASRTASPETTTRSSDLRRRRAVVDRDRPRRRGRARGSRCGSSPAAAGSTPPRSASRRSGRWARFASGRLHLGRIAHRAHVRPVYADRARASAGGGLRRRRRWSCAQIEPLERAGEQGPRLRRPGLAADPGRWSRRSTAWPRSCSSAARRTTPSRATRSLWTTLAYAVATAATGNLMLAFAAAAARRRSSGWSAAPPGGITRADPDPRHLVADDAVRAARAIR